MAGVHNSTGGADGQSSGGEKGKQQAGPAGLLQNRADDPYGGSVLALDLVNNSQFEMINPSLDLNQLN